MSKLTRAELYDRLVKASANGEMPGYYYNRDTSINISCRYTGDDGGHCAIGVLLKDLNLLPQSQSKNNVVPLPELPSYIQKALCKYAGCTLTELISIQEVHDGSLLSGALGLREIKWDHARFVRELNRLPVFAEVKKEPPDDEPADTSSGI